MQQALARWATAPTVKATAFTLEARMYPACQQYLQQHMMQSLQGAFLLKKMYFTRSLMWKGFHVSFKRQGFGSNTLGWDRV